MNRSDQSFPWRADVQRGCKGTVFVHRSDSEQSMVPVTVLGLFTASSGRDRVLVQYDGVAEDKATFSRNIAGFEEMFRRNRKGKWISLDRRPSRYRAVAEWSNHFKPGVQLFQEYFPF